MQDFEQTAMNWLTGNKKRVAFKTTSRRLTSLRSFAKWAGWGSVLEEYRAPSDPPTVPHPIPEGIPGVRRMIDAATADSHKALIALCGLMGLRISEALSIRPSDFNMEDMMLKVVGKGDKTRYVPISQEAMDVLLVPLTRAFAGGADERLAPISDRTARKAITIIAIRARISRSVASHDLRATFATAVYDKTQDMRLVQELLGHSSVNTTQIYVEVNKRKMKDAVEL